MKYLKKVFDWFFQAYEPEKPKLKLKTYKIKGKTYYLKKLNKKKWLANLLYKKMVKIFIIQI